MIQRIQTLYLALAILLTGAAYTLPIARYEREGGGVLSLKMMGLVGEDGQAMQDVQLRLQPYLIGAVAIALFVAAIALFRNRPRQARITGMACLVLLVLQVALYFTHASVGAYLGSSATSALQVGFFMPLAALLAAAMAWRAIRGDEELVRSADRLR